MNLVAVVNHSTLSAANSSLPTSFDIGTVVDITYLILVSLIGVFGNLMVICSIVHGNKVHNNGNLFIINLAVADLVVTGILTPPIIANVLEQRNVLPPPLCDAAGYFICTSCVVSVHTLAVISLNRYWAVVRQDTFHQVFSKKRSYVMIVVIAVWSHVLTSPLLLGWSDTIYDDRIMVCTFDNNASRDYTILIMIIGLFTPMFLTCYFYAVLFRKVKLHGDKIRQLRRDSSGLNRKPSKPNSHHRSSNSTLANRERNLIKTLVTSCLVFVISWSPYVGYILFTPHDVDPLFKRVVARLILSNSAMNFIIYGLMSKIYRDGYKQLLSDVWKKLRQNLTTS